MKVWLPVILLWLLVAVSSWAQTTLTAKLKLAWEAPATNTDGTPLTDLAGYRVYVRTAPITPCPPSGTYRTVSTKNPAPPPGTTVSRTYSGFTWGTRYYARVTALDLAGNLSACSNESSAVTNQPASPTGLLMTPTP